MKDFKMWAKAAGIRAIKTVAQAAVSLIPLEVAITEVDWIHVGGVALLAGIISLLTSLKGLPEVKYAAQALESKEGEK